MNISRIQRMHCLNLKTKILFIVVFIILVAFLGSTTESRAVTLTLSCGPDPGYAGPCRQVAEEWAKKTGNQIKMFYLPGEANDQLAIYQQLLSAKHSIPDIIRVDVIWPGILQKYLLDLNRYIPKSHIENHHPSLLKPLTVDTRLVAIPFYNETGILYYRKDLLEKYNRPVPTTWKELVKTAELIMREERIQNPEMTGYIWDGRPYEGLTCNVLEWIGSYRGGKIIEDDGSISVNNPMAIQALEMAASWVGTISPKEILSKRMAHMFTTGNAVFRRGWSGGLGIKPWWSEGRSSIREKVGVAPLPGGGVDGQSCGTIGTENLGISKYSKYKKEAADLVKYLTSKEAQIKLAEIASYNPSISSLNTHPKVLKALPYLNSTVMGKIVPIDRPAFVSARRYNKVTKKVWKAAHSVLSGRINAADALDKLEKDLIKIKRDGWPDSLLTN